jgi:hypothetical protein
MHHRSEKAQVCKRKRDDLKYRAGEHATPSWHDTQTLEIVGTHHSTADGERSSCLGDY